MSPVKSDQQRRLRLLGSAAAALFFLFLLAGMALYEGWELPPLDLRDAHTTSDGYAPPPRAAAIPPGTVSRASLSPANHLTEDGSSGVNPLASDPRAVSLGQRVYHVNCAMCHGEPGESIGPVGERYNPQPPPLQERVPALPEARLYASITEGIRSTPTPETAQYLPQEWHAFRTMTSERERWAAVAYLRSAFGGR